MKINYLKKITKSVQKIAEAVALALEANVTIVDQDLTRVAGTGPYLSRVYNKAPKGSAFEFSLQKKSSILVEDPGKTRICLECSAREECIETYEICTPIIWNDLAIGVLGIFAFNEEQKNRMHQKKGHYLEFLNKMADLIGSKVGEAVLYDELSANNQELDAIIKNVDKGVLCIDQEGKITQFNKKALELLMMKEKNPGLRGSLINKVWPDSLLQKALIEEKDFLEEEEVYSAGDFNKRFLTTVRIIRQKGKISSVVGTFSDLEDLQKSAYRTMGRSDDISFEDIIGKSKQILQTKELAKKVAKSNSTILITGESGTGKEFFARAIHKHSSRSEQPFVGINCSAIPETLLESELFGYEGGAFTGAKKKGNPGKIELAHCGTLFLDEIGDMPLFLQSKLLRFLQEMAFTRVGGLSEKKVDVRVISATNKNIDCLIREGLFREDLYYRLNVVPIRVPPLRERPDDIPLLVESFLEVFNERFNKNIKGLTTEAIQFLIQYSWPGNVRELENIIEYAINFSDSEYIPISLLKTRLKGSHVMKEGLSLKEKVRKFERQLLIEELNKVGWDEKSKMEVAKNLGISRATLYRKLDLE